MWLNTERDYPADRFYTLKLTLLIFFAVLLPTLKISPGPPLVIAAIPPAFFARNKPAAVYIQLESERGVKASIKVCDSKYSNVQICANRKLKMALARSTYILRGNRGRD